VASLSKGVIFCEQGTFPPFAPGLVEIGLDESVGFEPYIRVPIAVLRRGERPFFVFRRQEIPDPHAESLHRRIAVPGVVRMRFRVENGRGKNRIAEMFHPGVFSMDSSVVFGIAR
jgi:hypothetical protein